MKTWSVKRSRRGVLHYQELSSRDWSAPLTLFRPPAPEGAGKMTEAREGPLIIARLESKISCSLNFLMEIVAF